MNNSCIQACDMRSTAAEPTPYGKVGPQVYSTPQRRVAAPDDDLIPPSNKGYNPPDRKPEL